MKFSAKLFRKDVRMATRIEVKKLNRKWVFVSGIATGIFSTGAVIEGWKKYQELKAEYIRETEEKNSKITKS